MLTLTIQKRDIVGKKVKKFRTEGIIPAVLYGKKEHALSVTVDALAFARVFKQAGMNTVIGLAGEAGEKEALIHDVAIDPVRDVPMHVDFYVIEKGQKVQVSIPIEFTGSAPAVKELGGVLVKVIHELEVEAEPSKLPPHLMVDVSSLVDFESRILVKDVVVPDGVTLLADADEVVVLASEAAEEEVPAEAPDLSKIEVEKKGKQEGDDSDAKEKDE